MVGSLIGVRLGVLDGRVFGGIVLDAVGSEAVGAWVGEGEVGADLCVVEEVNVVIDVASARTDRSDDCHRTFIASTDEPSPINPGTAQSTFVSQI